jgi:hypothetical protein
MRAGSLVILVPAILLAGVSMAGAQNPPRPPPVTPPPPPAAPPPPQGPAALSVPDPLAGFRPGPRDLYQSPDGSDRFQHISRYPAGPGGPTYPVPIYPVPIYPGTYYPFGSAYGAPYYETSMAETYRMSMAETYLRRQRESARGSLVLQAVPSGAQIFVDGHYGLAEEFGTGGATINLDAGTHQIEVRAPGYEPLTFTVMIEPNSLVRYRGSMQAVASNPAAAAPQAKPAPAKSFYVIPNCYAGDKPPSGTLPKGCDIKNLQTRK